MKLLHLDTVCSTVIGAAPDHELIYLVILYIIILVILGLWHFCEASCSHNIMDFVIGIFSSDLYFFIFFFVLYLVFFLYCWIFRCVTCYFFNKVSTYTIYWNVTRFFPHFFNDALIPSHMKVCFPADHLAACSAGSPLKCSDDISTVNSHLAKDAPIRPTGQIPLYLHTNGIRSRIVVSLIWRRPR